MNRPGAIVVLLVLAAGCGDAARPVSREGLNLQAFHDEDAALLKLVLEDLLRNPEFQRFPSWSMKTELVVWDTTEGLSAFITTGQMSAELTDRPPIPVELYNSLKGRNGRKVSLGPIDSKQVRMGKPGSPPNAAFEKMYPVARAYVSMWLPAYSEEGTTALVRFAFGPTPHGACGTYFLERSGGSWKILWRKISYYA